MATWKLKTGRHFEKTFRAKPDGTLDPDDQGRPVVLRTVEVHAGETFDSEYDFSKDPEKFQLVAGTPGTGRPQPVASGPGKTVRATRAAAPAPQKVAITSNTSADPVDDGLEEMTNAQLQQLAEDEEIDLTGASKKADMIAAIRLAREGA